MRTFPQRQQSAEARVAQSLLFGFIALLVQRQGFVIDKTTGPGETSQMAKLFAVGHGLELVALPSEHPKDDASWMTKSQDLSRRRHCVLAMHVQLVSVTKKRYRVLDGDAINRLRVTTCQIDGEDYHR